MKHSNHTEKKDIMKSSHDCCHEESSPSQSHHEGDMSHGDTGCHGESGHGAPGMSHGSAKDFLKRFWIVTGLLIPLVFLHPGILEFLGFAVFPAAKWIQFGLAIVIFRFALVFFEHAWHEIKMRRYGMMTLVSMAVGAGFIFSVASTFLPALEAEFYIEISSLIWVLLFGHYLEARSSGAAGDALQEVAKLLPKNAHKIEDGVERDVLVDSLVVGDRVMVKPGEKVPADGVIVSGEAHVDESLISGESKPIRRRDGDEVVAGSICLDGALTLELSRVGEHSTIGQIQTLIATAQKTKPKSQRIADKASAVLTVVAGTVALLTLVIWTVVIGETFVFAITLAITVLVIACPHALGLAIPTVTTITTSLAVKNGIFIKDLAKIETVKKADYVVFDKTGTLTRGEFGVTDIVAMRDSSPDEILRIAASLEQHSSHIIGHAILANAKDKQVELAAITDFQNIAGQGITAKIGNTQYIVGNEKLITENNLEVRSHDAVGTIVYVADEQSVLGYITLSDALQEESRNAIEQLHSLGLQVAMITGDNEGVAKSVADELGIDTYFAEVLPEDKYAHVKKLQDEGNVVLMVGDGVNDAPALTQADVGIAIGAGTDVAVESGDIVLTQSSPLAVAKLIKLSRAVYRKMIENLVWALGYNVIAIPAAAGVFASFGFFLRPEIGALLMSLSTVIVVANAMRLRKITL